MVPEHGHWLMKITKTQHRALKWLATHGGHASLDRYNASYAQGEKSGFTAGTWLRLMISGHVVASYLSGHFGLTKEGVEAARKARP